MKTDCRVNENEVGIDRRAWMMRREIRLLGYDGKQK